MRSVHLTTESKSSFKAHEMPLFYQQDQLPQTCDTSTQTRNCVAYYCFNHATQRTAECDRTTLIIEAMQRLQSICLQLCLYGGTDQLRTEKDQAKQFGPLNDEEEKR